MVMPASSEEEIFNFEENIESAFLAYFKSKKVKLNGSPQIESLPDDFISVEVTVGAATGHISVKPDGSNEYGEYEFEAKFSVRTERGEGTPSQTANIKRRHMEIVALVRKWLAVSNAKGAFDPHLSLYEIETLTPSGTDRDTSDDLDFDETSLNYAGSFAILTTAWPVS